MMGDAIDRMTAATIAMKENTIEAMHDASQTAGDALEKTTEVARSSTEKFVTKNPLTLGLCSIAVGFLVGLFVPISSFEREYIGPLGDRLTDRARDSATDLVSRVKSDVVEAISAALKPAKS
jgi:ElaB/YqjD/DUF883 family membrane-anchored ribosome-binding protein